MKKSREWSSKAVERIAELIPNLKVEILDPVLCKGYPPQDTLTRIDSLADTIALKHTQGAFADCAGVC